MTKGFRALAIFCVFLASLFGEESAEPFAKSPRIASMLRGSVMICTHLMRRFNSLLAVLFAP
jgi:membrane-bound acyltransferase YfiQ involved in biofilm formation